LLFFTVRKVILSFIMKDSQNLVQTDGIDLFTFGQRLRHLRRMRGLTLTELGERIDRAPSVLSLIENGRREPKLSLIEQLATVLSVPTTELLSRQPPSRRAQLEIAVAEAQRDPSYRRLGLPQLKIGARVPTDVLEHLVAVAAELRAQQSKPAATPEEARAANAALREAMRERGNYFEVIEREAADTLRTVGYSGGALSQGMLVSVVNHHGFAIRYVQDLPRSVRSLTDLRNHRIYVKQEPVGADSPRAVVLQALGHFLLGHQVPRDFADFLRQRVEVNYFAAAVLMPETAAAPLLDRAKKSRDLAVEDLVDLFSVSYEMAAHRFTNLATHHLGLPCHFVKNDASGIIYKAYENDGVVFPADPSGAIEGQRLCRTVGRAGLALSPGALAHPVRASGRQLPRRGRRRYLRVPRPARPGRARLGRRLNYPSGRCGPRPRSGGSSARSRPGWPRPVPSARRPGARATSASCCSARRASIA
jgi:transcriptional regulator with XRE-family HTH domain